MNISKEDVQKVEDTYQKRHQVEGVSFVTYKEEHAGGLRYATDNDNAVFTGMYLAAACYRYKVEPTPTNLAAVANALGGIRLLTNVTGTPGVLVRWAFPLENSWNLIGYDAVKSLEGSNSYGNFIRNGTLFENNGYAFITKTTKDQLSGVLFGLSVAFALVPETHEDLKPIVSDLISRLRDTNWSLRDHTGNTGGTSAHRLDAPQKLILKTLHNALTGSSERATSFFFKCVLLSTIHYNRIITRTFSFNLNSMEAHALYLLSDFHAEKKGAKAWVKRIHSFMKKDHNPHFEALYYAAFGVTPSEESIRNLEKRVDNPYPKFFSWQKDPEDWWNVSSQKDGPNIDILLPYWIIKYTDLERKEK